MAVFSIRFCIPLVLLALMATPALAQLGLEAELQALEAQIEARSRQLDELSQKVSPGLEGQDLLTVSDQVRVLRRDAEAAGLPLLTLVAELDRDLQQLGESPGEGQAEEPALAQARTRLAQLKARAQNAAAESTLNVSAATRLAEDIAVIRRDAFTGKLLARGPLLTAPGPWRTAAETLTVGALAGKVAFRDWLGEQILQPGRPATLWSVLVAFLLAGLLLVPLRRVANRLLLRRLETLEPLPSRRVLVAALRALVYILPGLLAALFVSEALRLNGAIPADAAPLARTVWLALLILLLSTAGLNAVFAPRQPQWRVTKLSTGQVLRVRGLVFAAAMVITAEMVLRVAMERVGTSPSLTYVEEGVVALLLGIILFLLARTGLWIDADEGESPPTENPTGSPSRGSSLWSSLRRMGRLVALSAVLAAIAGFAELGHYLTTRSFALLALLALILALRALFREGVRLFDRRFTSHKAGAEEDRLLHSWIGIAIDLLAVFFFVPPALLTLGAEWVDVRGWIADAFFGFQVGGVRISLAKILSAVGVFVALLWVTRTVQKTADSQLFPRSRIDLGVQNSLRTLMGYVGLVVALAAGIGTLGFDLSSLAIIAGALSVGIGFGLQSIVNNFVSGLILLFERPIKVGDWIITNSGEGIVKKISVRSTEIETFDRSSVIVPNSELISSAVTNWTHKDKVGRIIVRVGAAYDSDAQHVLEVLQDVAAKDDDLLSYPAPLVVFEDFGASSIDFSVRGYIRDVSKSLSSRTRLRVDIHRRFKEEGIEIPFPQRDLNVRGGPDDWPNLAPRLAGHGSQDRPGTDEEPPKTDG